MDRTVKQALGVSPGNGVYDASADERADASLLDLLGDGDDDPVPGEPSADVPGEVYEVRFRVEQNYAGWRLDRYLCEKIRRLSRTKVQRVIKEDLIYRGSGRLKPSTPVAPGLEFSLRRRRDPEPECPRDFRVAYEDEDVLVVDKPAGLAIHPTARYFHHTLTAVLRERQPAGEKWDIAHRLDRETSGLVVCGKHPAATGKLKLAFARRGVIRKEYLALVHGWPEADDRIVDLPLALLADSPLRVKMGVRPPPEGKEAVTRVVVERRFRRSVPWRGPELALVRCHPRTGRQHQLRVHLAAIGHPIVGDKIYGPCERYFQDYADGVLSDTARAELVLPRQALHAAAITFPHPRDGREIRAEAPLPGDLAALLDGDGA
jgi:23S rRNA pseudouridine1911/1915/1917 synthase